VATRDITAFRERVEIVVDNVRASAALRDTEKQLDKLTGVFKTGLGVFNKESAESIEKIDKIGGSFGSLLSGPVGMAAGIFTSIAGSVGGAGYALFQLADRAAEAGDKIFELSEKSGFSARTISAFKLAAEAGGSTIEDFAAGLSKFNINMAAAAEGNEKLGKAFQRMGVDVTAGLKNPDAALAQFMKRFAELPTNQERVIAASEIFGKKFGANLVGTFNQAGGDLDAFMAKMEKLGIVIDDETAKTSNEFEDLKKQFETQFGAMTRTIGYETLPAFMTFFTDVNASLEANQKHWKEWGETTAGVILTAEGLVISFGKTVHDHWDEMLTPVTGQAQFLYHWFENLKTSTKELVDQYEMFKGEAYGGELTAGRGVMPRKGLGIGEDGDGDGGGKKARAVKAIADPLKQFRDLTDRLSASLENWGDKTELARVKQELLRIKIGTVTDAQRKEIEALAALAQAYADQIDARRKLDDETKKQAQQMEEADAYFKQFVADQRQDLERLTGVTHTAHEAAEAFLTAYKNMGGQIEDVNAYVIRLNASLMDTINLAGKLGDKVDDRVAAFGDMIAKSGEGLTKDFTDKAGQDFREELAKAGPPPSALPKWKHFFTEGLMGALQEVAARAPQQQVGKKRGLFSKILGYASPFLSLIPGVGPILSMAAGALSSGLGGDWGGAITQGVGAFRGIQSYQAAHAGPFAGVTGGASGGPAARAMGGPVSAGESYLVGEHGPELFTPGGGGMIASAHMTAVLADLRREISRLGNMPAEHVVMKGARGLARAMDSDASLSESYGRRLRLA